jgi:hypothetical protein
MMICLEVLGWTCGRRILAGGMIAVWRLLTQAAGGAEIRVFTPRTGATALQELQSRYQKQTGDTHC